jgi:hypothetical protein
MRRWSARSGSPWTMHRRCQKSRFRSDVLVWDFKT